MKCSLIISSLESRHSSKLGKTELDKSLTEEAELQRWEIITIKGSEETFGTTQISSFLT